MRSFGFEQSATVMVALAAALVVTPAPARACTCQPFMGTLPEVMEASRASADVVFYGRVVAMKHSWRFWDRRHEPTNAIFQVLETFKGEVPAEVTIQNGDGANCVATFAEGEFALVYANHSFLGTAAHLCSRTRPIDSDDPELDWLRSGKMPQLPVALQREELSCQSCDLPDAVAMITAAEKGGGHVSAAREDLPRLLASGRPWWVGPFSGSSEGQETAYGVDRNQRPFCQHA